MRYIIPHIFVTILICMKQCLGGHPRCVHSKKMCDGKKDCSNGWDETDCSKSTFLYLHFSLSLYFSLIFSIFLCPSVRPFLSFLPSLSLLSFLLYTNISLPISLNLFLSFRPSLYVSLSATFSFL